MGHGMSNMQRHGSWRHGSRAMDHGAMESRCHAWGDDKGLGATSRAPRVRPQRRFTRRDRRAAWMIRAWGLRNNGRRVLNLRGPAHDSVARSIKPQAGRDKNRAALPATWNALHMVVRARSLGKASLAVQLWRASALVLVTKHDDHPFTAVCGRKSGSRREESSGPQAHHHSAAGGSAPLPIGSPPMRSAAGRITAISSSLTVPGTWCQRPPPQDAHGRDALHEALCYTAPWGS